MSLAHSETAFHGTVGDHESEGFRSGIGHMSANIVKQVEEDWHSDSPTLAICL
jgi:hypothetical protein